MPRSRWLATLLERETTLNRKRKVRRLELELLEVRVAPALLHVAGNQLEDAKGNPVVLRGVDVYSLEYNPQGFNLLASLNEAITQWDANLIRLPLNEDYWFGYDNYWDGNNYTFDGGAAYRALVGQVVETAAADGVYVVLDLHWSDMGVWGANNGQHEMPDDHSTLFWQGVATQYANNPTVFFDPYNEPNSVSWSQWLNGGTIDESGVNYHSPGMQGLLNTIRATGANNIVVPEGLNYDTDLSGITNGFALTDPAANLMYQIHLYPAAAETDAERDALVGTVAEQYPLYVGEWGSDTIGDPNTYGVAEPDSATWNQAMLAWLNQHQYSWTAWAFVPAPNLDLISDVVNYTPTSFYGVYVKAALAANNLLTVTSFTPTPTGFTATFSEPFLNTINNPVHLYSANTSNANYGPSDVTLVGRNTGPITGSLIFNSTNTGFTFIKTNLFNGGVSNLSNSGLLAANTYTVTFLSSLQGFKDTSNKLLDGNYGGIPGTNFASTFIVTAPPSNAVTVSIPDFARGPDTVASDSINLVLNAAGASPPSPLSGGIPVILNISSSDSAKVTSAIVTLQYSMSLLTIDSAFPNPALSGASLTLTSTNVVNGNATTVFTFNSPTALPTGNVRLGGLAAYVPSAALYRSKQLLQISSVINGGAIPSINDNALQVVAFLGNTSGTGSYSSLDGGLMLNAASGADAGFASFPALDPAIVGDLNGNGTVDSGDAIQLNIRNSTGSNPAFVPNYPGPPSTIQAGPDPAVSIPSALSVNAQGTVLVPVNIDDAKPPGSTGMMVAQLALRYDPSQFIVSPQDVQLGSVPAAGTGWQLQTIVDQLTGEIGISLASRTPIESAVGGSLVTITLHAQSTAMPGTTPLQLVASVSPNGRVFTTSVDDAQGPFTLTPAPTNGGPAPGQMGSVVLPSIDTAAFTVDGADRTDPNNALPTMSAVMDAVEIANAAGLSVSAEATTPGKLEAIVTDDQAEAVWTFGNVALATPKLVPVSALTEAPIGVLHGSQEQPSVAASVVSVAAGVQGEAPPLNRQVLSASVGPVPIVRSDLHLLFSDAAPESSPFPAGVPTAGSPAMQGAADQVFQTFSDVKLAGRVSQPANNGWLGSWEATRGNPAAADTAWSRNADPLLSLDEEVATNLGLLDGYFALVADSDGDLSQTL